LKEGGRAQRAEAVHGRQPPVDFDRAAVVEGGERASNGTGPVRRTCCFSPAFSSRINLLALPPSLPRKPNHRPQVPVEQSAESRSGSAEEGGCNVISRWIVFASRTIPIFSFAKLAFLTAPRSVGVCEAGAVRLLATLHPIGSCKKTSASVWTSCDGGAVIY